MYPPYKKLLFFDKKGDPINFRYDENKNVWVGSIHFEEVGVRLFENNTIFIVEEFQDTISPTFNVLHGTPHKNQNSANPLIYGRFINNPNKAFKFFSIDNPYEPNPLITVQDEMNVSIIDSPSDTYDVLTDRLITSVNIANAVRFDIAINSDIGGVHTANLILEDDGGKIAEIEVYGEVIAEDERFSTLLANFGWDISEKEEFIFRSSDINEDLPNYEVLNQKRKELLFELHNIDPYLSGYRGIVNIVKYFGYYDLKIKEYWKNVDTGKTTLETVILDENDKLDKPNQLLSLPYKKTSYFGLFYDINRIVKDEYDEDGLPITEDSLIYSNEEIIIKLFGLKQYIKDRDIGGVADIVDIIGEAYYFNKYNINTWMDNTMLQDVDIHIDPCFVASKTFGYIEDVRYLLNNYAACPLPRNFIPSEQPDTHPLNHGNCFLGFFYPMLQDTPEFLDEPNIQVGFPVTLNNCSFDLSWSDGNLSWEDSGKADIDILWNNISHLNFYEVEWIVKRVPSINDPRKWETRTRGKIDALDEVLMILPYDGFYDVTLILYGWNNNVSKHTKKNHIEVRLKEADFITYHRLHDSNLQTWENNYITWENNNSEWENEVFKNDNYNIGTNDIQNRSFNIIKYIDTDALELPFVGVESPTWEEFLHTEATWDDFQYVTWKHLIHERERLSRFAITKIVAGGTIQIGEDVITIPLDYNINDFRRLAELLNEETGLDVGSFEYTARTVDDTMSSHFIDCVSIYRGKEGDKWVGSGNGAEIGLWEKSEISLWNQMFSPWKYMPLSWDNMDKAGQAKAVENPFGWDNVNINIDKFFLPIMVNLFMVVDNSRMVGKTIMHWKITNNISGEVVLDVESPNMVYRFTEAGSYDVLVQIWDTNGNKNEILKSNHIIVLEATEYKNKLLVDNVYSNKPQPRALEAVFL